MNPSIAVTVGNSNIRGVKKGGYNPQFNGFEKSKYSSKMSKQTLGGMEFEGTSSNQQIEMIGGNTGGSMNYPESSQMSR